MSWKLRWANFESFSRARTMGEPEAYDTDSSNSSRLLMLPSILSLPIACETVVASNSSVVGLSP